MKSAEQLFGRSEQAVKKDFIKYGRSILESLGYHGKSINLSEDELDQFLACFDPWIFFKDTWLAELTGWDKNSLKNGQKCIRIALHLGRLPGQIERDKSGYNHVIKDALFVPNAIFRAVTQGMERHNQNIPKTEFQDIDDQTWWNGNVNYPLDDPYQE